MDASNNSPPTLIGAGHQWTVPTNTNYIHWLTLTKSTLKVALAGSNRTLAARISKCGWAIRYVGAIQFVLHILQHLPIESSKQQKKNCYMSKSTMEHQQKSDWKIKPPHYLVIVIGNCMFFDVLIEYIGLLNCIHYSVWSTW